MTTRVERPDPSVLGQPSALGLDEAVELGYTLVDRLGSDLGIRVLAMKGPVLRAHGLRGVHRSADVDAWVHPRDHSRFGAALVELGWVQGGPYTSPIFMPRHSATFHHAAWPCEIDLHHYFPGFLAPADEVFDTLWDRRGAVVLGERPVVCVDRVAHAAVAGLHYLRQSTNAGRIADLHELTELMRGSWSEDDLAALGALAVATGSELTLRPLLLTLGAMPPTTPEVMPPAALADWRLRSETRSPLLVWLVGLQRTRWRHRPAYLFRALVRLPHPPDLRRPPLDRRRVLQARLRRLRRVPGFLRALPLAVRELRRHGSGRR